MIKIVTGSQDYLLYIMWTVFTALNASVLLCVPWCAWIESLHVVKCTCKCFKWFVLGPENHVLWPCKSLKKPWIFSCQWQMNPVLPIPDIFFNISPRRSWKKFTLFSNSATVWHIVFSCAANTGTRHKGRIVKDNKSTESVNICENMTQQSSHTFKHKSHRVFGNATYLLFV